MFVSSKLQLYDGDTKVSLADVYSYPRPQFVLSVLSGPVAEEKSLAAELESLKDRVGTVFDANQGHRQNQCQQLDIFAKAKT
jgi:hypothetical protein